MDGNELKTIIASYLLSLVAFFTPLAGMVLLITFAVLIDTYVGRSYAKWSGKVVTSGKTRVGFIRKMITYSVAILFSFLLDHFILNDFIKMVIDKDYLFTIISTLFLINIEYTSIDEKVKWRTGKSITDRIGDFVRRLKDIIVKAKDIKAEL